MTRAHFAFLALTLLLLTGCAGPTPTADPGEVEEDPPESYTLTIEGITVAAGDGLNVRGKAILPKDHCVYTQLFADGAKVDWWLVGKCYPLEGADWSFTIPLGGEGTPAELDDAVAYRLEVWWPGAPGETRDSFEFDLAAPPAP